MSTAYDRRVDENMRRMFSQLSNWHYGADGTIRASTMFPDADQCNLCGHQPIKAKFWVSSAAGLRMEVGSECIKRFPFSAGKSAIEVERELFQKNMREVMIPMIGHIVAANKLDDAHSQHENYLMGWARSDASRMREPYTKKDHQVIMGHIRRLYMER